MPYCTARRSSPIARRFSPRLLLAAALLILIGVPYAGPGSARAEDDARTLSFVHTHRDDSLTITYKRNGLFIPSALKKLNWFLRDWRNDEETQMDPRLFDVLWNVYREIGATEPIYIVSSYRSPKTNAMLRRRSRGVARHSQHMLGKAIDFFIPGVPLEKIRIAGLRLQRGGVGYYPTSGSPFVHLDVGNVRHWPRMTHDQLVRVFPDGKTVHIPSDGHPLRNYALAAAELQKRGSGAVAVAEAKSKRGVLARLFGIGAEEDDETAAAAPAAEENSGGQKVAAAVPLPRMRPRTAPQTGSFTLASADEQTRVVTPPVRAAAPAAGGERPVDVINERGLWPSARTGTAGRAPARLVEQRIALHGGAVAAGDSNGKHFAWITGPQGRQAPAPMPRSRPQVHEAERTASIPPWPGQPATAEEDRVPTQVALSYAAQAAPEPAPVRPVSAGMGTGMGRPARDTTIAVKNAPSPQPAVAKAAQRLNDPWLRGIVIAPSIHYSMRVAIFGAPDSATLRMFMRKPASVLALGFSDDPNRGMSAAEFSGNAVAFLPTVSFVRTASLHAFQ